MFARFLGFGASSPAAPPDPAAPPSAIAEAHGDLFKYYFSESSTEPAKFYLKNLDAVARIFRVDPGETREYAYVMQVFAKDVEGCVLEQEIRPHMQLETYEATNSFAWTSVVLEGPDEGVHKWSIIFTRPEEQSKFLFELKRAMYEASTQMPFVKVKEEDRAFCLGAADCGVGVEDEVYDPAVDFLAFDGLRISENAQERRRRLEDERGEGDSDEEDVQPAVASHPAASGSGNTADAGDHNSLLVDSARHKKTFVVRGNNVGVFNRGDDCEFDTELAGIQDLQGRGFTPHKIMLHDSDTRLLMLDRDDPTKVFPLDLETGKVVEEWNVDRHAFLKMVNFTPSTKHGNIVGEQTLVAMTGNVVVGLDPRLTGRAKAIGNPHDYVQTSNPGFTCCATTAKGHLAVGTAKGEIKFFVGVPGMPHTTSVRAGSCPKTAKTILPGLGDEVIGLDLTADGSCVLATCRTYLLVISTLTPDAKSNGFETRLGKDKPRPRRLCLTPEDQREVGWERTFTPASFNRGNGELFIVTSMGAFIITWNFRLVQQGNTRAYVMKRTSSDIMSEQFFAVLPDQPGYDVPIVLAHKDDVAVEKRKSYDRNPCGAPSHPLLDRMKARPKRTPVGLPSRREIATDP